MSKGPKPTPVIDRLLERIEIDDNGCWLWTGYCNPDKGYGQITCNPGEWPRRTATCHTITYHFLIGDIPDGLELDHRCRVRRCCNPFHLEPVTTQINTLRGLQARFPDLYPV